MSIQTKGVVRFLSTPNLTQVDWEVSEVGGEIKIITVSKSGRGVAHTQTPALTFLSNERSGLMQPHPISVVPLSERDKIRAAVMSIIN